MPYKDAEQRRRYAREWVAKRKAEWFADKACARCGGTENLQLDHIDPCLKVDHRIWSWSAHRREAELVKCQVLCAVCHNTKTTDQYFITHRSCIEPPVHGTRRMYERGCRCDPCCEALRSHWRERRRKQNN